MAIVRALVFHKNSLFDFCKPTVCQKKHSTLGLTISQILDSSKLKDFTDDNFRFDESGRKFSKWVENAVGKEENCSLGAVSPFPSLFSNDFY